VTELTRQDVLDGLVEERQALMVLLSDFDDAAWHTLTRDDGWNVHSIVAHIADVHLFTLGTSSVTPRPSRAVLGVTLPMKPNGRLDVERLNMMRYQFNRGLSRDEVMERLAEAFALMNETIEALNNDQLRGPGPYGPGETMLEWFHEAVLHNREHRRELQHIYEAHARSYDPST
jgi:hypothetical protein